MRRSPAQPGDRVAREHDVDEPRLGGEVALVGGAVGLLDARIADQVGERPAQRRVAPAGGAQLSWVTWPPAAAMLSAKPCRPTLTTLRSCSNSVFTT